jgi:glycosyltransferase involved in cell wall biosynthesis
LDGKGESSVIRWSLISAVNDDRVLETSLLRSPEVQSATDVILKRGFSSAGKAYNSGLEESSGDIVILAHQDVYLPPGWIRKLDDQVQIVNQIDPKWGVLGVCGVTVDGKPSGHVYSTGLRRALGAPFGVPVRAGSVDEMVIILRSETGLRFDDHLPGFHLYGTDICLEARQRGFSSFLVSNFCVHNSNGLHMLPWSFWRSYLHLRAKWYDRLPVVTPCTTIYPSLFRFGLHLLRDLLDNLPSRRLAGRRVEDPARLYEELDNPRLMNQEPT